MNSKQALEQYAKNRDLRGAYLGGAEFRMPSLLWTSGSGNSDVKIIGGRKRTSKSESPRGSSEDTRVGPPFFIVIEAYSGKPDNPETPLRAEKRLYRTTFSLTDISEMGLAWTLANMAFAAASEILSRQKNGGLSAKVKK